VLQTTGPLQDSAAAGADPLSGKRPSPARGVVTRLPGARGGGKRYPWLWRVLRASLPFQLALVLCFCVACLLEPHCCDNLNNLSMSLTPQLRYVRGPPPI